MIFFFVLSASVITICVSLLGIKYWLRTKSIEISEQISGLLPYNENSVSEHSAKHLRKTFTDIHSDLNRTFCDTIISTTKEKAFINHYASCIKNAYSLLKKYRIFNLTPPADIIKFIDDFDNISRYVKLHNDKVYSSLLTTHKTFF